MFDKVHSNEELKNICNKPENSRLICFHKDENTIDRIDAQNLDVFFTEQKNKFKRYKFIECIGNISCIPDLNSLTGEMLLCGPCWCIIWINQKVEFLGHYNLIEPEPIKLLNGEQINSKNTKIIKDFKDAITDFLKSNNN